MVNITTPLLIIGAALPRTSTTSTKMALEQLGYKVLHALSSSKTIQDLWNRTAVADFHGHVDERQALMDQLVEQMSAEGFNATLDQPSCFFYQDFMEYYPDAKVLNTQRTTPRKWAQSMVETAYAMDVLAYKPPYNLSPYQVWSLVGRYVELVREHITVDDLGT